MQAHAYAFPLSFDENDSPRCVLRPGFVAVQRAFWEIRHELSPSEQSVLLTIMLFTSGYLRQWCLLGAEKLASHSKVNRNYLFQIIKSLKEKNLIEVERTHSSNRYRLGDRLEVLILEADQVKPAASLRRLSRVVSPAESAEYDRYQSYPADSCIEAKEIKETIDQHHAPEPPAAPAHDVPSSDDALSLSVAESSGDPAKPVRSLVAQLQELGVNGFVAHRLARSNPPEKIDAALKRVRTVKAENPAAYVVAELQRGGYVAAIDKTKAVRQLHEEIREHRKLERRRDQVEEEEAQARVLSVLEEFDRLPEERQVEVHRQVEHQAEREGFTRVRGWSRSHPLYRGLLSEFLSRSVAPRDGGTVVSVGDG